MDITEIKRDFSSKFFGGKQGVYAVCVRKIDGKQVIFVSCSATAATWLPDFYKDVRVLKQARISVP
jgi:hypothetical protein